MPAVSSVVPAMGLVLCSLACGLHSELKCSPTDATGLAMQANLPEVHVEAASLHLESETQMVAEASPETQ